MNTKTETGPPTINTFRSLSDPETLFYAPPLIAVMLDLATLFFSLFLVLAVGYTPLLIFSIVISHALACSIGFREPHASHLGIAFLNSRNLPRLLFP